MIFRTTLTKIDFSLLMVGFGLSLSCMESTKSSKAFGVGAASIRGEILDSLKIVESSLEYFDHRS